MIIKYNMRGFDALRRAPGVQADIDARTNRVAEHAGAGFEAGSFQGRRRYRGSVITTTPKAMARNAKHNTLLRSLDAGR